MNRLVFLPLWGVRGGLLFVCLLITSFASARSERVIIQGDHGKLVAELQTPDVMPSKCPIRPSVT